MSNENFTHNDFIFSCILINQEVSQRFLSELIGVQEQTREVKQTFNIYLKHGEKFRNRWTKAIRDKYGDEGEEIHETDADHWYDIMKLVGKLKTDEQYESVKEHLKNLIG